MTPKQASELVAARVKEARQRKGWTAEALAERCAQSGVPEITRSVIANIETGRPDNDGRRRRQVTVEELLTFARVLEVPPLQLLTPLDGGEALQVVPSEVMDPLTAVEWLTDDSESFGLLRSIADRDERVTERVLRHRDKALLLLRGVSALCRVIRRHEWQLTSESWQERFPGSAARDREAISVLGVRLLHLLDSLKILGYTPPSLDEVREILRRNDVPGTLAEWKEEQQAREAELFAPYEDTPTQGE